MAILASFRRDQMAIALKLAHGVDGVDQTLASALASMAPLRDFAARRYKKREANVMPGFTA
jgi:hypothetical protein